MKIKAIILTFLLALAPLTLVLGQRGALKQGDKNFEKGAWVKAIPYYERYLKRNEDSQAAERLGDCYGELGMNPDAARAYEQAVKAPNPTADAMLKFGRALHQQGRYEDARDAYLRFQKMSDKPAQAEKYIAGLDQIPELQKDSAKYSILKLPGLNSEYAEIMPVRYKQGILFASNRPRRLFNGSVDLDTDKPFFDLYYASGTGINFSQPELLPGKINSKFHDGPASFGPDSVMYITLSNYSKGRFTSGSEGENHLVIFTAWKDGNTWSIREPLPFNGEDFTSGHPAISPDGKMLVFASDRPGGFGKSDLWMAKKEGVFWSEPSNLGARINTDGNEYFPSFGDDGTLYYSSDGIGGLGGLDIYDAPYKNGAFLAPQNLGFPINTASDDFGLLLDNAFGGGYFCSNRPGSQDDDIYAFKVKSGIEGTAFDALTGDVLTEASVEVIDKNGAVFPYTTDDSGKFMHICKPGEEYQIKITKPGYLENKTKVSTSGLEMGADKKIQIRLSPELNFVVKGTVRDAVTSQIIPQPNIELVRSDGQKRTLLGTPEGSFSIELDADYEYNVLISKKGYMPTVHRVSTLENDPNRGYTIDARLSRGDFTLVEGQVLTLETGEPMEGVGLTVIDITTGLEVKRLVSGKKGIFYVSLPFERLTNYAINASKAGYFTTRVDIEREGDGSKKAIIRMKLVEYGLEKIVKVIYYGYNSAALSSFSRKDLNEIYYFLQQNPEATIELGSHTDSRGTKAYNLRLSQRRSESVVRYFVEQRGVSPDRILAKGYGEEFLVNDCDDYKTCTEEGHSYNRRSEIKVVNLRPVE